MSGSRLGRGRGGRLALYGSCGVVALLLIFLYRAAISEMTRLRDLHEQCAHQQEALAAQLQVIFEYKVRLEKSLAEEKSSNAAVKQELQQRASREKSLRDKDSIEAMRRFDSLQQTYQLLQTEHQDLQEECKKHKKQALDETNKLKTTLQDLHDRIEQAKKEKEKSMEHLKTKYLELQDEKTQLENKYNELMATNGNADSTIDHLRKEVIQLQRELESAKKSYRKSTSPDPPPITFRASAPQSAFQKEDSRPIPAPQPQQQVSSRPLYASRNIYRADGKASLEDKTLNKDAKEEINSRLSQNNGNIISTIARKIDEPTNNDFQQKQQKNVVERPNIKVDEILFDREQGEQVMSSLLNQRDDTNPKHDGNQAMSGSQAEQPLTQLDIKKASIAAFNGMINGKARAGDDELQALEERVNGILNHNLPNNRIH
ncbi:hypothetical protein ACFW04_006995 [Cataglyphis niger]